MGDNGEVLQGLNDRWTFMGGNIVEWSCGLMVFCLISLFAETPGRAMPFMLIGGVLTTTSLASLRNSFPDEERGVRNALCAACGFPPIGIPAPSSLQPVWSASPIREIAPTKGFVQLDLDYIFPSLVDSLFDEEF